MIQDRSDHVPPPRPPPRLEDALIADVPDDETLLARIATHRDRDAFAALFRAYAPRLAGFFARSGLPRDVRDELVQEVMLRVWRKATSFDPARASVPTWLFAIARNARTDHLRRPATRVTIQPLDPAWVDDDAPHAEDDVSRKQVARDVRAALQALPPEQAEILEAAYFHHKTLRAIAQEGGVALGTVKSRVRLAFQRLRGALEGRA